MNMVVCRFFLFFLQYYYSDLRRVGPRDAGQTGVHNRFSLVLVLKNKK